MGLYHIADKFLKAIRGLRTFMFNTVTCTHILVEYDDDNHHKHVAL